MIDMEQNIWLVNFQNKKTLEKRSIMRILVNLTCLVIAHYSKLMVSFVDIFCAFCGAITLHIYQNPIYYRDRGWMLVIKILQLKMILDLFLIKAHEGRLDCGHCDLNLMQFLKWCPIRISISQSWMLCWKDLLQKPVMNANSRQQMINYHSLKQMLVLMDQL